MDSGKRPSRPLFSKQDSKLDHERNRAQSESNSPDLKRRNFFFPEDKLELHGAKDKLEPYVNSLRDLHKLTEKLNEVEKDFIRKYVNCKSALTNEMAKFSDEIKRIREKQSAIQNEIFKVQSQMIELEKASRPNSFLQGTAFDKASETKRRKPAEPPTFKHIFQQSNHKKQELEDRSVDVEESQSENGSRNFNISDDTYMKYTTKDLRQVEQKAFSLEQLKDDLRDPSVRKVFMVDERSTGTPNPKQTAAPKPDCSPKKLFFDKPVSEKPVRSGIPAIKDWDSKSGLSSDRKVVTFARKTCPAYRQSLGDAPIEVDLGELETLKQPLSKSSNLTAHPPEESLQDKNSRIIRSNNREAISNSSMLVFASKRGQRSFPVFKEDQLRPITVELKEKLIRTAGVQDDDCDSTDSLIKKHVDKCKDLLFEALGTYKLASRRDRQSGQGHHINGRR